MTFQAAALPISTPVIMSRKSTLTLLIVTLIFLGFRAVQEYARPYYTLLLRDLLRSPGQMVEVPLLDDVSVRLYSKTRPYAGKISTVQKGLVLVHGGEIIAGDGYGFGVPVLQIKGKIWLASKAKIGKFVRGDTTVLSKLFVIDTREQDAAFPRRRYITGKKAGTVRVDYYLYGKTIEVRADFSAMLKYPIERIFMMNEQAARTFLYGLTVAREKIDPLVWEQPVLDTKIGLAAPKLDLSFWFEAHSKKFLGRELITRWSLLGQEKINWAGCDLGIDPPVKTFRYKITIDSLR